jgi:hypothetical protein
VKLMDNAAFADELDCSVRELQRLRKERRDFPRPLRLRGPRSRPKWDPQQIEEFKARLRAEAQA